MKKHRLLSLLLALTMMIGFLPAFELHAEAAVVLGVDDTYNTKSGTPSQSLAFRTGYVRNKGAGSGGNGTARQLEVMVQLNTLTSSSVVGAVVMRATDYASSNLYKGSPTDINDTSIFAPNAAVQKNYYGVGLRTAQAGETELKLEIVDYATADKNSLLSGGTATYKNMAASAVKTAVPYYFEEYVLVVFAQDTSGLAEKYYVDRFYLDSEGYVRTPSYMVQYDGNNPPGNSDPGGVPGNQIQRAAWDDDHLAGGTPDDMRLSNATPTCTGYAFLGWTTAPLDPLAEGTQAPANGTSVTSGTKSATFYAANNLFPKQDPYSVTKLYALWRTVPVKFSHADGINYTVTNEGTEAAPNWVMSWKTAPQVGVALNSGGIGYAQPAGSGLQPAGTKTFSVETYQGSTRVSTINPYNNITVGRLGNDYTWGFIAASGPTNHTYKDDGTAETYSMVVTVTDPSNNTSDTITVRFSEIQKRAQDAPDKDVNTGLEGAVNTLNGDPESKLPAAVEAEKITELGVADAAALYADGFTDGQIIGFYSTGRKTVQNSASGETMNDKSGSLRDYYLKNGMVYEYRPLEVDGTPQEYDNDDAGWREVPVPQKYYTGDNLTKVESAMAYKTATTACTTMKIGNPPTLGGESVQKVETKQQAAAWGPAYGWIEWNADGLPVVHGLTVGDVYQVRFRANTTSSASDPVRVTVTAGGGGGDGGETPGPSGGLAVNLAGGTTSETQSPANTQEKYNALLAEAAKLQPGDTLDLSAFDFEPVRENYSFAGWTTGEVDPETKSPKLYRAPTKVTVTWIDPLKDGDDKTLKTDTMVSGGALPAAPTPDSHDGQTFLTWRRTADAAGNITCTADYVPAGTVTYIWRDSAAEEGAPPLKTMPSSTAPEQSLYPEVTPPEGKTLEWVIGAPETAEGEGGVTTVTVYITATYPTSGGTTTSTPYEFQVPTQGVSSLAAVWEATTGGFFPIVFYDWDGVTLLGTKIVPKTANAADQQRLIDEAMEEMAVSQMSAANAEAYRSAGYDPAQGTDAAYYDKDKPLSNKKGYTFGKWIDFDAVDENGNEVYTNYGAVVSVSSSGTMAEDLPEPAGHVFTAADRTNGITVKAAYRTNASMVPLTENSDYRVRNYVVETESYTRFAGSANYGITVTVRRVNTEGQGVHRVRKLGLRVSMTINGNTVYSLQTLDNADVVTAQVAVSDKVSVVSIAVVDLCDNLLLGGSSNWVTGSAGRSNLLTENMGGTGAAGVTNPGFIMKGNLSYICDEAYNAQSLGKDSSTMTLAASHLTTAGLDYNPVYGQAGTSARDRMAAAKENIYKMCVSLPERRVLTWDEMQEAIKRGTVWDKTLNGGAGGWTNGFTGAYVP